MNLEGKKINFLGDSITQGHGTSDSEKIFSNLLKMDCSLKESRNYGIGGTRIAKQTGEDTMAPAYVNRYSLMDDDADVIVVFGGTNDYGHGNAKLGTFSDCCDDTFYGACHLLIQGLMNKYPKSLIVFMTPLHRENEFIKSELTNATLKEYVDIINEVCEYYSIPVLDLYKNSGIQPNVEISKTTYCPDGLHPNDNGHIVIKDRLKGFLATL